MPFPVPSLSELRRQARSQFAARLPGADMMLPRGNLPVTADVMAGLTWGQYGYLDRLARELMPDLAGEEYLERWCRIFAVYRRGAVRAGGDVTFTGVDGAVVVAGTVVESSDAAASYVTQVDAEIADGAVTTSVSAIAGGVLGNLLEGAGLVPVTAIPGVDSPAAVAAGGLTGGVDTESDDSLRVRLLARIRQPPQGGAAHDYLEWATEIPGVTRAWVFPLRGGAGSVDVTFTVDDRANPIPLPDDVEQLYNYLQTKRPVTARLAVWAPVPAPVAITISRLYPDNDNTRAAVVAALGDVFRRLSTPAGATVGPGVDPGAPGGTFWLADLYEAIAEATGVLRFDLVEPPADVEAGPTELLTLGAVTFL